jgi:cbb3-type cytochrome oxidase subunit 3
MSMIIRSSITVVLFAAFIAMWLWAWRKENAGRYAAAARLPLEDGAEHPDRKDSSVKGP